MNFSELLLPLRGNALLRRTLRRSLRAHVARRPVEGTSFRIEFVAGQHLGLYFTRRIRYEPNITRNLARWLPRGGVAIDVGANLGLYTLLMLQHLGDTGSIWAFEPDPQNLPWLEGNLRLNAVSNVQVIPRALGENSGEFTLYQDTSTTRTSSLLAGAWQPDTGARKETLVRVDRLDTYSARFDRLDFVKIDTEGFECAVLGGALSTLSKFTPTLLVEVTAGNRAGIESLLSPLGYAFHDPVTLSKLTGRWPGNVLCVPPGGRP